MSDDECVFYYRKMNNVCIDQSDDIRDCPECKSYCTRLNTKNRQVMCTICSGNGDFFTFCWDCNEPQQESSHKNYLIPANRSRWNIATYQWFQKFAHAQNVKCTSNMTVAVRL
ncbi:hypothetical protein KP79_PYT23912 [Mizuhopecten yessoensis]|uniref:Uncharacterized protein n=1 Tax=Mizuhopecten yessoensis TaxID=6573 RepID=A0A210PZ14_MIZYE|nr:hypothetical protein KP79_PYT23912 [Mizuhopecten yessoensis]